MAKTTVLNIIAKIKRRVDYDINDDDLDNLLIDIINDALHFIKQLFLDHNLMDEIGETDNFDTVASQEYIVLGTETIDFDQHIQLSQRTNDDTVEIIPMAKYRELFPDPTVNKSNTADVAAFFANRIYFGPTPSAVVTYYLDYVKLITELTSTAGSLPFENKYDPVIIAFARREFAMWKDDTDTNAYTKADLMVKGLTDTLIKFGAKNIGLNQQTSRRDTTSRFGRGPREAV